MIAIAKTSMILLYLHGINNMIKLAPTTAIMQRVVFLTENTIFKTN